MKKLLSISWILIYVSLALFLWYLIVLFCNGYINPKSNFDFGVAKDIGAFVGNFIAPLLTFAGTLLLIANLKEVEKINDEKRERIRNDKILELCEWYLSNLPEIRIKFWEETSIPKNWQYNLHIRLPLMPSTEELNLFLAEESIESVGFRESIQNNHKSIVAFLLKLEYFALQVFLNVKKSELDAFIFAKTLLGEQFINETKFLLLYIRYYQLSDEAFCKNIIELYKDWGGQTGTYGENIVDRIET
jgi:hypothetical protein